VNQVVVERSQHHPLAMRFSLTFLAIGACFLGNAVLADVEVTEEPQAPASTDAYDGVSPSKKFCFELLC